MSIGTDRQFRYVSIKNLIAERPDQSKLNSILDIGTGTGHLANELNKQKPSCFVTGMDISLQMLEYSKDRQIYQKGLMNLVLGDAAKTPYRKGAYDAAMSGFVGRHFLNYKSALTEHNRILRSKGRIMMLEMGRNASPLAFLIDVYVGRFMSLLGKLAAFIITKGKAPFRLLEDTYAKFHSPSQLKELFESAGFKTRYKLLLLGSIVVVLGRK
jgi:demethylmenaquinone methyltransferase/2-methoxy-6-polyprenyl-1,4-benzoquinol methylase